MNLDGPQWTLLAVGCLLMAVGAMIFWYQSRAKSCTRHSHMVGRIALVIGCGVTAAGMGVVVYTLSL